MFPHLHDQTLNRDKFWEKEFFFQLPVSVSLSVHHGGDVMVESRRQEHIAHFTKGQETEGDQHQEVV